ncbi:MAG: GYD domain-containing protein [Dehalococcoidia bacterium]
MPLYMYQVSYTPEAWADLARKPQDRSEAIKPMFRSLKGRLLNFYLSFGEYDLVVIAQMPDDESAAALSIAASAGGAIKSIKTTPLMTVRQGLQSMRKAKRAGYAPPA